MQDPTAPIAPPPVSLTNTSPKAHQIRLVLLGIIALVLIAVVAYFWKDITSALALRDVRIAEAQYRDIHVQKFSVFGMQNVQLSTDQVVGDYAQGGATKVAVVGEGAQEVVLLSDGGRALTSDGLRKAALAVSADGTKVAYAALTGDATNSNFVAEWTVRIVDVASGASMDLGAGFGPEFFVRDGVSYLLYTTPTQLTVFNINQNVATSVNFFTPSTVDYTGRISADGMYFASRTAITGKFDLYSVERIEGLLELAPLGTIQTQLADGQWVGNTFYGLTDTAGTASVLSVSPANVTEERVLGSFDSSSYYRFIR